MKTKLSHSSVEKFNKCGKEYDLYYNQHIRPVKVRSALLFGKALDHAFNALLTGATLNEAQEVFTQKWNETTINGDKVIIPNSDLIIYTKNDTDEELLKYWTYGNMPNKPWISLKVKGLYIIESFHKNFLPLVKKVVAVQKPISLFNGEGDEITGNIDLIVEFHDGTVYLLDNKSSTIKYKDDSPRESQQLVLYYYVEKDITKLNGVGFNTFDKNINKNRKKICKKCGFDGSKTRHKTCPNEYEIKNLHDLNAKAPIGRCHGEWNESIHPTADWRLILNEVAPEDEERVVNAFDLVNEKLKLGIFKENYDSCMGKFGRCDYYDYCHEGKAEGLVQIEKKKI